MSTFYSVYQSPLGPITIVCNANGIVEMGFDNPPKGAYRHDKSPMLTAAEDWFGRYFAGQAPDPNALTLAPVGTPFQQTVWWLLRQIPYGQSVTYGALAQQIADILGKPKMSPQAIGGAVGKNPIIIAIPCHRVLGANGKLTGFSAGVQRKIELLRIEGIPFQK